MACKIVPCGVGSLPSPLQYKGRKVSYTISQTRLRGDMTLAWDITVVFLAITFAYVLYTRGHSVALPYPPGPPKDIFIGHARRIPSVRGWEIYGKWKEDYGLPIILPRLFAQG